MSRYVVALCIVVANLAGCQDRWHWYEQARSHLIKSIIEDKNDNVARNIILFVGDGMGMSTITTARILRGQTLGQNGEDTDLVFDKFLNIALAKTYNTDSQVGDSGACATALLCGVKSKFETIGLDDNAVYDKCVSSFTSRIPSLADWAQQEGKATGVVTTTRITHATPAAVYGHSASRYWESDDKMPMDAKSGCKDLARQLVEDEPGRNMNVILGGGRRHFMPRWKRDPKHPTEMGRRQDNRDLIDEWQRDKKSRDLSYQYVWRKEEFDRVNTSNVDYLLARYGESGLQMKEISLWKNPNHSIVFLLAIVASFFSLWMFSEGRSLLSTSRRTKSSGLFEHSHLSYESDRDSGPNGEPSLADMTRKAIEILRKNPHGYFLMVEGGRIDHSHHFNNAQRALVDTLAFENAVHSALEFTDSGETLIVVTADHSHVFTFGGYPKRGNPIFGVDGKVSDIDGMPYTTLLYSNGPGYNKDHPKGRQNLTGVNTGDKNYIQQSAVPRKWDTHGGEDVPVYAHGPMAHVFRGVIEQTYIPHAMAFAACIGPEKDNCQRRRGISNKQAQPCVPAELRSGTNQWTAGWLVAIVGVYYIVQHVT